MAPHKEAPDQYRKPLARRLLTSRPLARRPLCINIYK